MSQLLHRKLAEQLVTIPDDQLYAVVDGASLGGLLGQLDAHRPLHCCLYSGDLDPELAQTAPYLVQLTRDNLFTAWLIEAWGHHPGIFIQAPVDFRSLRTHLRSLLMVRNPQGEVLYFRYYDPRVLRVYLPSCTAQELRQVYGPIQRFAMEGEKEQELLWFSVQNSPNVGESIALA